MNYRLFHVYCIISGIHPFRYNESIKSSDIHFLSCFFVNHCILQKKKVLTFFRKSREMQRNGMSKKEGLRVMVDYEQIQNYCGGVKGV